MPKKELSGVLEFYSETGTEGGYWAFQDARFIKKVTPKTATAFVCKKCYAYKNKKLSANTALKIERAFPADIALRPGFTPPPLCHPECHEFEPATDEEWGYAGLHILENGDKLAIYDKNEPIKLVWRGIIGLKQKGARTYQIGFMGRRRRKWLHWFSENYPAKLIPHK